LWWCRSWEFSFGYGEEEESETQATDEEELMLKLSDAYAAIRLQQHHALACHGKLNLPNKYMVTEQSLKHLSQHKITDFLS